MIDLRHVLGREPKQIPSDQAEFVCSSYYSQTWLISSVKKV